MMKMFGRRQAALCGALAFIPALTLYSCSPDATGDADRTVHVAVTEKGAVQTFLNRFAMEDGQLVVTKAPLGERTAKESVALKEKAGERLYAVELNPLSPRTEALAGELARFGNFVIIAVPAGQDPHEQIGDHKLYAEALALTETKAPSLRRALPGRIGKGGGALPPSLLDWREGQENDSPPVTVDRAFIEQKAKEISGAVPVTIGDRQVTISERRSATGRTNVRAFLRQEYEALGYTVSEHAYGTSGGVNFIAERAGADAEHFVLLTAHLDSVANPGADDDGSGTVSVLAIAKAIAEMPLRIGVRVVGFDQEELGLLGSKAYARSLNDAGTLDQVVGVLNVEMTGYDSDGDGAFHAIHCNENTSSQITARVSAAVAREPINLRIVNACTNRSDHAAFWTYDVPAIVVSQNFFGGDSNPCYHAACDKVDRMNFDYMTNLTKVMAMAVADWVVE